MATYIIWLDSREAKVFKREGASEHIKHAHTHGKKHPSQPQGKHSEQHHPEQIALFKDVSATLGDASTILLMGPGEAKGHFKTYLNEHHAAIGKKVAGVETVDHPTDAQIHEIAAKFFKRLELGV